MFINLMNNAVFGKAMKKVTKKFQQKILNSMVVRTRQSCFYKIFFLQNFFLQNFFYKIPGFSKTVELRLTFYMAICIT